MFDPRDLLGKLMQSDVSRSLQARLNNAVGSQAPGGGSLGDMFANLKDQASKISLSDLGSTAESVVGKTKERVKAGDPLAIGGLAAAVGAVLGGGGGKSMRGALGAGLLGVLGSIAWKALQQGQGTAGTEAAPPPLAGPGPQPTAPVEAAPPEPLAPATDEELADLALVTIRAMISAAKADGEIDATERARIIGKLATNGGTAEEEAFLAAEMDRPLDIEALAGVATTPEIAVQVYSASLMAIEADTPAEVSYLQRLAAALGLDAVTVASVHATLGVPTPTTA
ncbi:MAG: DUF533 domain-containing protein [Defluviicoccus sp.]